MLRASASYEHAADTMTSSEAARLPAQGAAGEPRTGTAGAVRDLQFWELAQVLYRNKRMILVIALVGTVLAAVVGLLISPKYTATAELSVNPPSGTPGAGAFPPADESPIDTQVALLTSLDHLNRVAESLLKNSKSRTAESKDGETAAVDPKSVDSSPPAPAESELDLAATDVQPLSFQAQRLGCKNCHAAMKSTTRTNHSARAHTNEDDFFRGVT